MKNAFFAALILILLQFPANAQITDSANLLADITGSERISLPESFVFEKSVDVSFSSGTRGTKSVLQYKFRYPENRNYISMCVPGRAAEGEQKNPEVVLDFETGRIINFMCFSNAKMALIHTLTESKKDIRILKTNFKQLNSTGKSKLILGYSCRAYTFNNATSKGTVWITSEMDSGLEKLFSELGLSVVIDAHHTGYILLMESKESDSGEMYKIEVNKLGINDVYAIDSKSYVATSVPSN